MVNRINQRVTHDRNYARHAIEMEELISENVGNRSERPQAHSISEVGGYFFDIVRVHINYEWPFLCPWSAIINLFSPQLLMGAHHVRMHSANKFVEVAER